MERVGQDERSTYEVMVELGADVDRCHEALLKDIDEGEIDEEGNTTPAKNYEFHARQLIRSILAYIEGVTFSVKVASVAFCEDAGLEVSPFERMIAVERVPRLTDRGEVEQDAPKLRLPANVRLALRLAERAGKRKRVFDPATAPWWTDLISTARVRDRLTHPKLPGDLDVSHAEVMAALRAKVGFEHAIAPDGGYPADKLDG